MAGVSLLLTQGRVLRSGAKTPERLDVAVGTDGRIAALTPTSAPQAAEKVVDLRGKLVVPGLVDAHQHLDKSRTRRLVANALYHSIHAEFSCRASCSALDSCARQPFLHHQRCSQYT